MTDKVHPRVSNLLSTVFANNVALTEGGVARYLAGKSMQRGTPLGDSVRKELVELYTSPDTDWAALMENEAYEDFSDASQEDARNFVTQRISNVLFPLEKDNPPKPSA